jgi:hypothetical protein
MPATISDKFCDTKNYIRLLTSFTNSKYADNGFGGIVKQSGLTILTVNSCLAFVTEINVSSTGVS